MSTIRAQISPTILSKADRLFRNDDAGVFVELLQNARRAGANRVDIRIEQLPGDACVSRVTFHDNGGIDDFQKLLTLGDSDWTTDVRDAEDPAGMGFFSLCHSAVEVWSGNQRVVLSRDVFLGSLDAQVLSTKNKVPGTRIVFTRDASVNLLVSAARKVSEFGPIEAFINGDQVDRHDFLDGAQHREIIDGIEVGFGTSFAASERIGRRKKKKSNSRLGVFPRTYLRYPMRDLRCLRGGEVRRLTYSENLFDPLI